MMGDLNQQLVLRAGRGAVRVLTMNRPASRNALNTDLIGALHTALVHADRATSVRAVVLTGADPTFCAGLDLKQAPRDQRTLTGDRTHLERSARRDLAHARCSHFFPISVSSATSVILIRGRPAAPPR